MYTEQINNLILNSFEDSMDEDDNNCNHLNNTTTNITSTFNDTCTGDILRDNNIDVTTSIKRYNNGYIISNLFGHSNKEMTNN